MNFTWKVHKVGDLLKRSKKVIEVAEDKTYRQVKVKMNAKGVELRTEKIGQEIGTKRQYVASEGQFIISRIDARNGAFGLVPDYLNGAIVTGDFLLFDFNEDLVDRRFFNYYFHSKQFLEACIRASKGTTNRQRISEGSFSAIIISLPTLPEQKEIANILSALSEKIQSAKYNSESLLQDTKKVLSGIYGELVQSSTWQPMHEVAPIIRRSITIDHDASYPELGVRSFGKGTFHKPTLTGSNVGSKKLYSIHKDDLIFSNVFAWEGAIAVASPEDQDRCGSHRFITCIPKQGIATSKFLAFHFLSKKGQQAIGEASPGGAGRNRTLGLRKLEKIVVPVPDYEKQVWFEKILIQMNSIQQIQIKKLKELDGLFYAVMRRILSTEDTKEE